MFDASAKSRRSLGPIGLGLAAVVFAAASFTSLNSASAAGPEANPQLDCEQYTTSTGNIVLDEGTCLDLNYVPDVANADAESQRIALGLFMGTMQACASYHSRADVEAGGYSKPGGEDLPWQHYGSDNSQTLDDIDAMIVESANPPDVVVYKDTGEIAQTMFSGTDIANLGTIPQLHDHRGEKWEMLHINCKPTIEEAFRYGGVDPQNTDPSVYLDALQRAETGGIAAVSTQIQEAGGAVVAPAASSSAAPATTRAATPSTGDEDEDDNSGSSTGGSSIPVAQQAAPAARPMAGVTNASGPVVAPWGRSTAAPVTTTSAERAALLAQINQMSDTELARLLAMIDAQGR